MRKKTHPNFNVPNYGAKKRKRVCQDGASSAA
jgi:hypothetical protein